MIFIIVELLELNSYVPHSSIVWLKVLSRSRGLCVVDDILFPGNDVQSCFIKFLIPLLINLFVS